MGDEHGSANESKNLAATVAEPSATAAVPRPVVQPPRPVSLPPRPNGPSAPLSRPLGTPPPPPVRNLLPLSAPSQQPPAAPLRAHAAPPPAPSVRPTRAERASARSTAASSTPSFRPDGRAQELLAELMSARKELTEKGSELRKVISERNALRVRLAQAQNSARELASASRAEAQLRMQFVDAHAASSAALRARISELETALAEASGARKPAEQPTLRQIRGIGPAFERALLGLGITTVSQIAALDAPRDRTHREADQGTAPTASCATIGWAKPSSCSVSSTAGPRSDRTTASSA